MARFEKVTSTYEHALAYAMHKIDNRGLLIHEKRLATVCLEVNKELKETLNQISTIWGFRCYVGAANKGTDEKALNLNSSVKVIQRLKDLGYKVPKVRKKVEGEYEFKESIDELAVRMMIADPATWPGLATVDPLLKLLIVKELKTFKDRYINAKLYKNQYFCNSNVAATLTGRRGTKRNIFGFGGNNQNFPARGRLSDVWKPCIIARPGKIFLFVDQVSAEDWPVQALSENYQALEEMRKGVNRHYKFANAIFGTPIDILKRGRANHDFACEMEYYLGKKGRHANNYGMQPNRLSESLAGEGYSYPVSATKLILDKINEVDPNVRKVFHEYVRTNLFSSQHKLVCPLGRERQFFGLRPNEKNYSLLNEAYAYIPQSTIGDNTGLAIVFLDGCNIYVVQESHDSVCQELPDNEQELLTTFQYTKDAFNRTITYHNGITTDIPIEAEIGYDWLHKVKIESLTPEGLLEAYKKCKEQHASFLEVEQQNVQTVPSQSVVC